MNWAATFNTPKLPKSAFTTLSAYGENSGVIRLLVADNPYLDRYTLPMSADLDAEQLERWRQCVRFAFEVLVSEHRWVAGLVAEGIAVITPLTSHAETDLITAASPVASGATATSWPLTSAPPVGTLVHEFSPRQVMRSARPSHHGGQVTGSRCPSRRLLGRPCDGHLRQRPYPHRYREGAGFRNLSVYCTDLRRLIAHVRERMMSHLAAISSALLSHLIG
jgi:hypothetical protein